MFHPCPSSQVYVLSFCSHVPRIYVIYATERYHYCSSLQQPLMLLPRVQQKGVKVVRGISALIWNLEKSTRVTKCFTLLAHEV